MKLSRKAQNVSDRIRRAMRKLVGDVGIEAQTWGLEFRTHDEDTGKKLRTPRFVPEGPVCAVGAYLANKPTRTSNEVREAAARLGIKTSQVQRIVVGFDEAVMGKSKNEYRKIGVNMRRLFDPDGYADANPPAEKEEDYLAY